jgi:hypothetical protein
MVRNTLATTTVASTLKNIVTIVIPASTDGTPVEYWVTGGIGRATVGANATCVLALAIKNGTTNLSQSTVSESGGGWSGACSVTVSSTPITLNLTGVSSGTASPTVEYSFLTATPITPIV